MKTLVSGTSITTCPFCHSEVIYVIGKVSVTCETCGQTFNRISAGLHCDLGNCKCRHCSYERLLEYDPTPTMGFPSGKAVIMQKGIMCGNAGKWLLDMQECPVPSHIRNIQRTINKGTPTNTDIDVTITGNGVTYERRA